MIIQSIMSLVMDIFRILSFGLTSLVYWIGIIIVIKLILALLEKNRKISSDTASAISSMLWIAIPLIAIILALENAGIISPNNASNITNYLGAIIGVFGAYFIAAFQLKKEKEEINFTREVKLIISDETFESIDFNEQYTHQQIYNGEQENLTQLYIYLLNGSSMPYFNLEISWIVTFDHVSIKNENRNDYLIKNTSKKSTYDFKEHIHVTIPKSSDVEKIYSTNSYIFRDETTGQILREPTHDPTNCYSGRLERKISFLEGYGNTPIPLPKFFIRLIENVFNDSSNYDTLPEPMHDYPSLIYKISFIDYKGNKQRKYFRCSINHVNYSFIDIHNSTYNFNIASDEIQYYDVSDENL